MMVRDAASHPAFSYPVGPGEESVLFSKTSSFVSAIIACLELSLLNTSAAEDCFPTVSHEAVAFLYGRKNVTIARRGHLSP